MDEFVCLTMVGRPGEAEAAFKARLTAFWSHMIREKPDAYEQVYAEATEFEDEGDKVSRQYMVAVGTVAAVVAAAAEMGVDSLPVDEDDVYSKDEASSSDWFQIDH